MAPRLNPSERKEFLSLASEVFIDWHAQVLAVANTADSYVPNYSDYPAMHLSDEIVLPFFSHGGGYSKKELPKKYVALFPFNTDYVGSLLGGAKKLFGLGDSPVFERLCDWVIQREDLKKYFELDNSSLTARQLIQTELGTRISQAVERSLLIDGLVAATTRTLERYLIPVLRAILIREVLFSAIIPIALLKFDFSYAKIANDAFLMKIPERFQLARSRIQGYGSGASRDVGDAATHALVCKRFKIPNDSAFFTRYVLKQVLDHVSIIADSFFAALRIVRPVPTGYAQLVYYSTSGALDSYADLPSVSGAMCRRYPPKFDNFSWFGKSVPTITREEFAEIADTFSRLRQISDGRLQLAIKRLNACFVRDSEEDALLDSTIGLELILGDDGPEAISYKLRIRAAALAKLSLGRIKTSETFVKVKAVYGLRSALVHGRKKFIGTNKSGKPEGDWHSNSEGICLLRELLRIVINNPKYLNPNLIDTELIIGSELENG